MTLGSPSSPSAASASNYLPSYLMGEPNVMTVPRTNTLSPTKGRTLAFCKLFDRILLKLFWIWWNGKRIIVFFSFSCNLYLAATSPTSPISSTNDFNRSMIQQRSLFGSNNQITPPHSNYSNVPPMSHNAAASGPPTQVSDSISSIFGRFWLKTFIFTTEPIRFDESGTKFCNG